MKHYYVDGVGFLNGAFTKDGIQYPANWIKLATQEERDAIGAQLRPNHTATEKVIEGPNGFEAVELTAEELAAKDGEAKDLLIAEAWAHYDAVALEGVDLNARGRFTLWLIDPASSADRLAKIQENLQWIDAVWSHYAADKAAIEAGTFTDYTWDNIPCPYTFWEIAGA